MKKIDLSRLNIKMLNEEVLEQDVSKEFAQVIFQNTQDIAEHNFSLELYKNPVVELTDDNIDVIKKYSSEFFKAFVQIAINNAIVTSQESQDD